MHALPARHACASCHEAMVHDLAVSGQSASEAGEPGGPALHSHLACLRKPAMCNFCSTMALLFATAQICNAATHLAAASLSVCHAQILKLVPTAPSRMVTIVAGGIPYKLRDRDAQCAYLHGALDAGSAAGGGCCA